MYDLNSAPCEHLALLFAYEKTHGNRVDCVKKSPDHSYQLQMYFVERLKIWGNPETGKLDKAIQYWDSLNKLGMTADECERMDSPPVVDSGFRCTVHGHIIAGPT